jgi:hypothetical protein
MVKKAIWLLLFALIINTVQAQTTYLQLGQEDYQLLDRIETRSGELSDTYFSTVKPVARKGAVEYLLEQRKNARGIGLSGIDRYRIDHMISVSGEWAPDEDGAIDSRVPWFRTFYRKQPDYVHVKTDNFFVVVNPVISASALYERSSTVDGETRFSSSRGVEIRGWVAKKIGFYTYFADNQEQTPGFVSDWIKKRRAVPGSDFYTVPSGNHYDYLLARGYLDFAAIKDHLNVTFGYDKHFIGDGERSLLLSDFSAGATFLRLNTRIWKLNYQNLYMELTPQFRNTGGDERLPHKYATIHHLSMNLTKWLNVGVFESVMFSRRDRYEFSYMIPIIFYRAIERGLGSPDNVNLGINFKAIAAKHLQFYGQLMLDEFKSKELFSGSGWWGNKFGVQLGGKYFDAFTVKNLDLQGEVNIVRPYTYTHYDSTSNYTHYNQPLAHPLGAGFAEVMGILRYQPEKNLYLTIKASYYKQGADTGTSNYGNDIFKDYRSRNSNYDVKLIEGVETSCATLSLNLSYELRENLFFDVGATRRMFRSDLPGMKEDNTSYFYGGLRLNIARRDYNFY